MAYQRSMNILYPKLRLKSLPAMFGLALLGALFAGLYGVLHDQITYSISPEYFTRMKFEQFHYANFGLPPRVFVGEIGFLATWWVGFFAAWFIARITIPAFPRRAAFRKSLDGFLIMFAFTTAASVSGYIFGALHGSDYSSWAIFRSMYGLLDLPAFVRVAYIHNASYLGGLMGLIAALVYLRIVRQSSVKNDISCQPERGHRALSF
jgi:hypothetical protein